MHIKNKRILFLSPHPDDSELGCGATIAKLIDYENDVHVAVFSNCQQSLPASKDKNALINEFHASMNIFSVPSDNRTIFDYNVRLFFDKRQNILDDIIQLRIDIKPEIVFIPCSNDIHQDHQVIHNEGKRAFLRCASIFGYELPWNMRESNAHAYIVCEQSHLEKKTKGLGCYQSQIELGRNYFSESYIRNQLIANGICVNSDYAEKFQVISILIQ